MDIGIYKNWNVTGYQFICKKHETPHYITKYNNVLNDSKLYKDLFKNEEIRRKKYGFIFNELSSGYTRKKAFAFEMPVLFVMIDFDLKRKAQIDFFLKTQNATDLESAKHNLLMKLRGDPHIWISSRSSGSGLRILGFVVPSENGDLQIIADSEEEVKIIHESNVECFLEYLKQYGIVDGINIDQVSKRLTQPTFSLKYVEGETYVNKDVQPLINQINKVKIYDRMMNSVQKFTISGQTGQAMLVLNQEFHNKIQDQNLDNLKPMFQTYNNFIGLLGIISYLDQQSKEFWYNQFARRYAGSSFRIHLKSFKVFNSEITRIGNDFIKRKGIMSLEHLMSYYGIFLPEPIKMGVDIFGNQFNKEIIFKKYIQEHEDELNYLIDSPHDGQVKIVFRAPAGSGKSTYFMHYLHSAWKVGMTVVFAAPNNGILEQKYMEYSVEKGWELVRNYAKSGHSLLLNDELQTPTNNKFYLSSYQSLYKIKNVDMLVLDECQNLVQYAYFNDKQFNFEDTKKVIFCSATPEPLLIGLKDYRYINLTKDINKKPLVHVYFTKQTVQRACQMILKNPKKSILVYYNDKERSANLQKKFNSHNIQVILINSDTKESPAFMKIVNEETIEDGIYLATDLMNEGINLLNKHWDIIIILDNYTSSFLQFYQLRNRFRFADPEIYLLMNGMMEDESVQIPEDIASYLNLKYEEYKQVSESYLDRIMKYPKQREKLLKKAEYVYLENGIYKINKNQIKHDIYKKFIEDVRKRRSIYFRLLMYFFTVRLSFLEEDKRLGRKMKLTAEKEKYIRNNNMIDWFFDIYQNTDEFLINYTQADLDDIILNKKKYQMWYQRSREMKGLIDSNPESPTGDEYQFNLDIIVASDKTYEKHKLSQLNDKLKKCNKLDRNDNFQAYILNKTDEAIAKSERTNRIGKIYFELKDVWMNITDKDILNHFRNQVKFGLFVSKNYGLKWIKKSSNGSVKYYFNEQR